MRERLSRTDERELLDRWAAHGCPRAHERLVASQQPMIRGWARRYRSAACSAGDLVQEGNVGLLGALRRFDTTRDVRLSTFASWYVRAHMLRFVERNCGVVRGATTTARRRLFYQLSRTREALAQGGGVPTRAELAEALGVAEDDVQAMEQLKAPATSLETPTQDEGRAAMEQMQDPTPTPEDDVAAGELARLLHASLDAFAASLSAPARAMLHERIATATPASITELATQWGISGTAARRLESKVATPLRRHLYRTMGDAIVATLGHC